MAYIAACTDKGIARRTNQDACCIQVAQTRFGEVVLAVVCDGVGGLSAGELASATVAYSFAQWFQEELPILIESMSHRPSLDFDVIQTVWGILLSNLNEMIRSHGQRQSQMLGTTFTGILVCNNSYLVGHVGDCRLYQISARGMRQVTEDQTLLAKKLAAGEITPAEAINFRQKNVILQSVGTEGMLHPAFYRGTCVPSDIFVMCCDGAYRKAEEQGIDSFFQNVDSHDEQELNDACKNIITYDLRHGEKDNLTVVCFSADLQAQQPDSAHIYAGSPVSNDANVELSHTVVYEGDGGEDPITMVQDEDDPVTMIQDEDDLITMPQDDEDPITMVQDDEDELPTEPATLMDHSGQGGFASHDDAPTMPEGDDA